MNKLTWRSLSWLALALALPLFSQSAKATSIDFTCSALPATPCNGTVSATYTGPPTNQSLVSAKTSSITVFNDIGPLDDITKLFTLKFDTTAGTASLAEIGGDGSTLAGTIFSASGSKSIFFPDSTVNLLVAFTTIPADFAALLGSNVGAGAITDINIKTSGMGTDTQVNISPVSTPEPASLALMGTGILFCARLLRRKKKNTEAAVTA